MNQTKYKDLTGNKYGKLTAIKAIDDVECHGKSGMHKKWLCKCECGNYKTVYSHLLSNGQVKSCGCIVHNSKAENLIGKRFGKLTVLSRDADYVSPKNAHVPKWICQCDCGNVKSVLSNRLRQGKILSCGCDNPYHYNLVGERFGALIVQSENFHDERKTKTRKRYWNCKCDCGNIISVSTDHLKNGKVKSCGCSRLNPNREDIFLNALSSQYKDSASRRGLEYTLTQSELRSIVTQPCYYCGIDKPHIKKIQKRMSNNIVREYKYTGIDRIDSNKGYVFGNVVPCCKICNCAKSTLTQQEFFDWIQTVSANYSKDKILCV